MPPDPEDTEGYIESSDLPEIPLQVLTREEAPAFLSFLFGDLARRPERFSLRESAAVARYLRALARETSPGTLRAELERMARQVWMDALDFAPFEIAKKSQAMAFLRRHAETHLASYDTGAMLGHVGSAPRPTKFAEPVSLPRLLSRSMAVVGPGGQRLGDDLSERVFAAYTALRAAGIHGASTAVARAIKASEATRKRGRAPQTDWGADEVRERCKRFRGFLTKQHGGNVLRAGKQVANKWIYLFRGRTGGGNMRVDL